MSEPGFREIQLNTKQVVFLLMAFVIAGVGIFLLGVSTGKGLAKDRPGEVVQTPDPAGDVTATGAMPPATSPKPDEFGYHIALQGRGTKPESTPPTPPDAPPDPKPTPTTVPAVTAKPSQSKPAPTPTPAARAGAPASGGYFVQVNSFGSRANAEREVKSLKAKGIAAFIFESKDPGPKFKVRVGPFADLPAAQVMQARLRKEGFSPSVTR
ncbi:MAG TPA: SPOR domain-containing protein [Vicinamibacterales bacterium]|nr:SPOR domain-containing protein [Vicinamibacterales bacterium]